MCPLGENMAKLRKRQKPSDPIARELDYIKRLLMLQLVNDGVSSSDIAKVLGVANSAVSEIIPVRSLSCVKKEKS